VSVSAVQSSYITPYYACLSRDIALVSSTEYEIHDMINITECYIEDRKKGGFNKKEKTEKKGGVN